MHSLMEGESTLLGGPDGRFPYDGDPDNVVWPVIIERQKSHYQASHSADDPLWSSDFGGFIADATEEVEARCQTSLIYQKRRLVLDRMPCDEAIQIPRGPVVELLDVKYLDIDDVEQELLTTHYRLTKTGAIYFKSGSGAMVADGPGVVWIDMVCGYGETPQAVSAQHRELVMAIATHRYERREMAAGGGLDEAFEKVIDRKCILAGADIRYV